MEEEGKIQNNTVNNTVIKQEKEGIINIEELSLIIEKTIHEAIFPLIQKFNITLDSIVKDIGRLHDEISEINDIVNNYIMENNEKNNNTIIKLEEIKKTINNYMSEFEKIKNNIDIKNRIYQAMGQIKEQIDYIINDINTDKLTGLRNKDALFRDIKSIAENSSNIKYLGMLIDIDYFKKINDSFGHDVGDKVLARIGEIINNIVLNYSDKNVNKSYAYRMGGEEIGILKTIRDIHNNVGLNRKTTLEDERDYMTWLAEKISLTIKNDKVLQNIIQTASTTATSNVYGKNNVTVSIGVGEYPMQFVKNNTTTRYDDEKQCFIINVNDPDRNIIYKSFGDELLYEAKKTRDTICGSNLTNEKREIFNRSNKINELFENVFSKINQSINRPNNQAKCNIIFCNKIKK